jgi:hypothetical protein
MDRHGHFVTLTAYWLTGRRFAKTFVSQASAWMDANPPKLGINWASSRGFLSGVISWLWAETLCRFKPDSPFISRLLKYLVHKGHTESYLSQTQPQYSPDRRSTGFVLSGAALPELSRATMVETGLGILLDQLAFAHPADGVYSNVIYYRCRLYIHARSPL